MREHLDRVWVRFVELLHKTKPKKFAEQVEQVADLFKTVGNMVEQERNNALALASHQIEDLLIRLDEGEDVPHADFREVLKKAKLNGARAVIASTAWRELTKRYGEAIDTSVTQNSGVVRGKKP